MIFDGRGDEAGGGASSTASWPMLLPEATALAAAVLEHQGCYDAIRRHQAPGYLTPPDGSSDTLSRTPRCNVTDVPDEYLR